MRTEKMRKRYGSTFKKWLAYYALVLVLPLAIGLIVYIDTVNIINNQVERVHEASLNQLKIILDGKMNEIYQIGREIAIDDKVQSLIYKKAPVNSAFRYSMHEVRKDFVKYMISNHFIKSIGLYFSGMDYMMTDAAAIDSGKVRETVENTFSMDYDTWLKKVQEYNYKDFETIKTDPGTGKAADSMILFQTVSMPDGKRSPAATLMILINLDELKEILYSIRTTDEEIFIKDNASGLYLGTRDTEYLENVLDFDAGLESIFDEQYQNQDMIVTHTGSAFTDWEYISVLPSYVYLQKVQHIKTVIIIYVAVCLLFGLGLAYYLARRSYNPLKNLIQATIQKVGGAYPANQNEFGFLEHSLDELVYEKEDFRNRLQNQSETIRRSLIGKIVKGGCDCAQKFLSKCKAHGISFPGECFIVINFSIEEIGLGFLTDDAELSEDTVELVNFIVRNITEEIVNEKHTGYMAEVDGMMVCIVNLHRPGDCDGDNDIHNEMIYLSMKVQNILEQYYDISMFTAISNMYTGIGNVPDAYGETLEVMEYKNLVGKTEKVMQYNAIRMEYENSLESSRTINSEKQLMNLIAKGDYKNAQLLLNDLFSYYTPQNLPSLQIAKCRIFSLVNCMLNSMGDIKSAVDVDYFEALDPVQRLLNSKNIHELQREVDYIFNGITGYFERKNADNIAPKIAKILDFIQNHHADFCLNACVIAEEFDISTSYLSRIFNKNMNMGLVDYIHKVRLENAKILMPTNLSIKEIAAKVGYGSSLALIRAFKKYEGTTPGKYREAL